MVRRNVSVPGNVLNLVRCMTVSGGPPSRLSGVENTERSNPFRNPGLQSYGKDGCLSERGGVTHKTNLTSGFQRPDFFLRKLSSGSIFSFLRSKTTVRTLRPVRPRRNWKEKRKSAGYLNTG